MAFSTWIRSWKRSLERRWALCQTPRRKAVARRQAARPRLEALEDRWLLSPYIVTSNADSGSGTLRDAITQANLGSYNEIDFKIGTSGSAQTINLTSQLPTLTANGVYINGLSQGGSGNTTRLITLNGTGAGSSSDGLLLQGSGNIVSGLILENFTKNGIEVAGNSNAIGGTATGAGNVISGNTADGILIDSGVSGVTVQGNYIGTNTAGTAALANKVGIEDAGNNNTIGGSVVGVRNIISGNTNDGVLIDSGASGNVVSGNILGLNASGSAALANSGNGLEVQGTSNTIGGPVYYARNFIAGNSKDGILLGSSSSGNQVLDNFIGLNISGTLGVANLNGVEIAGSNNTLGSTVSGGINFISGNTNAGVLLDSAAKGNLLLSNDVGTDYTGQKAVANSIGIEVAGAGNTIGGTVSAARNIISGNSSDGVKLDSSGSGTLVIGSSIGINSAAAALTNGGNGLNVLSNSNTIGGTASGSRNIVSANSENGILIASGASGNQVLGNYIGTNIAGSAALSNSTNGIEIAGNGNTIGGTTSAARNVISGNTGDGIKIDSGASGNQVLGNYVGINAAGSGVLSNSIGIEDAGNSNTLGGSISGARNIISGNTGDGVLIDSGASGNQVLGNFLGLNPGATAAMANSGNGIEIQGASNTVGGPVYNARNFIAGNSKDGILLGSSASGNLVLDTFIGLNISGTLGVANLNGVEIAGTNNTLGSTVSGGINYISGNSNDGVLIDSTAKGNLLLSNDVGTDYTGQKAVANSIGIEVAGAGNTLGGTVTAARNIVSGNSSDGVKLDSTASGTLVLGNSIGVNAVDAALANGGNGLDILSTTNTIGGTVPGSVNVISGNSGDGILLASGASGNQVLGNFIGTNFVAKAALGNSSNGIEVGGNSNMIGGTASAARNIISGNSGDGVKIDSGVSGIQVQGNYIGLNSIGSGNISNGGNGIEDAGSGNVLGGSVSGARNVVSSSGGDGILLDSTATGDAVQGNFLGLNAYATAAMANSGNGLEVQGTNNTIGGSVYFARNYISGNSKDGLLLGSNASGNLALDNFIGLDITGTNGVGNLNGVEVAGSNNTIGSTVSGGINDISGNTNDGVLLDSTATGNLLLGNDVGTDYTGQNAVANSIGVEVAGAGNTLGGTVKAARNIIAGNSSDGVKLDSTASGTLVLGNSIGINSVDAALANGGNGLNILSTSNTIGGTASGSRNIISGNGGDGVLLASGASGNQVLGNYVGLNLFGSAALGNSTNGIEVGGNSNTIGGTASAARNVISGNTSDGVLIDSGVSGIQVQGNYIGLNTVGTSGIGNSGNGIEDAGSGNILGGSVSGARNVISGNFGDGILLDSSASGDAVQGNFLGLNSNANAGLANGSNGVEIQGTNNTVGGSVLAARNYISGNGNDGVLLGNNGNLVVDNFIGLDISGTNGVGNANYGVFISGNNNTLGGTSAAYTNVISAGGASGVFISSAASGNLVQGSDIGTDFSGQKAVSNFQYGVYILGTNNTVGGTVSGARDIISGNGQDGVRITGNNNVVEGDYVGVNAVGAALGNGRDGVLIASSNNTVGGTVSGARNVIGGNGSYGVELPFGASSNVVLGNYIGTNIFGTAALGNANGVAIGDTGNTVGGTTAAARNIISGNTGDGVVIENTATTNLLQGNYIGLNAAGTGAVANSIGIEDAGVGTAIGGSASGARNVISGNTGDGVLIDSTASGESLQGNYIGLTAAGNASLANLNGVEVAGSSNTIGGTAVASLNVISGNGESGVLLDSSGTGNLIQGNYLGTDSTGKSGVANGTYGIEVVGNNNTIGGTAAGSQNVISGNSGGGVYINASGTLVQGNSIGINVSAAALGNGGYGVGIISSSNNTIGGNGAGNTIADNAGGGVFVSAGSGNTISQNSIYANGPSNTGPGISLIGSANNGIVAPTLTSASISGTTLTVQGTFSAPTANVSYVLEFFANTSSDPEGRVYLGSLTVKPTSTGTQNFTFTTTTTVTGTYPLITATLTDNLGDTSAFSNGELS